MFLFLKESVCAFLVFALCKKLLSVIIIMCIISAVYSTIDYSKLHETAIVLHTDVLAASIAASYC